MRGVAAVLTLLFFTACSGGGSARPANIARPDIDVGLTHEIFFGSLGEAPASIAVRVENRSALPITIRRVELSSPGMTQFRIRTISRSYRETIAAGGTKTVNLLATAQTTTSRPNEPLTLRAIVDFEGGGSVWRELVLAHQ